MKITEQRRIVCESDSATVAINENGKLYISSIMLTRQEAADYPAMLAQAIKMVLASPVVGQLDNN